MKSNLQALYLHFHLAKVTEMSALLLIILAAMGLFQQAYIIGYQDHWFGIAWMELVLVHIKLIRNMAAV